jgi:hypothetical protein
LKAVTRVDAIRSLSSSIIQIVTHAHAAKVMMYALRLSHERYKVNPRPLTLRETTLDPQAHIHVASGPDNDKSLAVCVTTTNSADPLTTSIIMAKFRTNKVDHCLATDGYIGCSLATSLFASTPFSWSWLWFSWTTPTNVPMGRSSDRDKSFVSKRDVFFDETGDDVAIGRRNIGYCGYINQKGRCASRTKVARNGQQADARCPALSYPIFRSSNFTSTCILQVREVNVCSARHPSSVPPLAAPRSHLVFVLVPRVRPTSTTHQVMSGSNRETEMIKKDGGGGEKRERDSNEPGSENTPSRFAGNVPHGSAV